MTSSSRMAHGDLLDHLAAESARFREVLGGCDPAARVPACPDWDAADLLWHLACVQDFWATSLEGRPARPEREEGDAPRPGSYAGLLAAFDAARARLAAAFEGVPAQEEAWTWSEDHTVGFIGRRQAHEALIHRLDAEQAAGTVTDLPADLATDGVRETLEVMFGGAPPWGRFEPSPHVVRVDCTDTDTQVWVRLGLFDGTDPESGRTYAAEPDIHVEEDPGEEPDAVVEGPAAALDAWLWRRGDDADVRVAGDRDVYGRFRASVDHPID